MTQERLYFYNIHEDSVMGRINQKSFDAGVHMKFFVDHVEAYRDLEEYLRSRGMNDTADFVHLNTTHTLMRLMLKRLNFLQYRKEIQKIMGYTPLGLIVKSIMSKYPLLRWRAVKLALHWVRSFFRPFVH